MSAKDEVVDLISTLIQFDTTNTGEPETTKGEAEAAFWVRDRLAEVGYTCEIVESGAPGRLNVFARLTGDGTSPDGLVVHGHLDVVPAIAEDWSVDPFSGAIRDGSIWGRGAVDMKDMVGMTIAVARELKRTGFVSQRDILFAFFADEEAGSDCGSVWIAKNRPDLFQGMKEAIGEVGGFSVTLPNAEGEKRRFYMISTGEKGIAWLKITAHGTAGHGSLVHTDNPIQTLAAALKRLNEYEFPIVITESMRAFLSTVSEETTIELDPNSDTLLEDLHQLGNISQTIAPTLKNTANATMLEAGYKINVVPQTASAVLDCRIIPGRLPEFEKELDTILGPKITKEWLVEGEALEFDYATPLIDQIKASVKEFDPDASFLPFLMGAGTDAKALKLLGISCYGFSPLCLPEDFNFMALFHGVDEHVPVDAVHFGVQVLESFLRKM